MQLVSFQTHYGGGVTMSTRSTMPTNDLDSYEGQQISSAAVNVPKIGIVDEEQSEEPDQLLKPVPSVSVGKDNVSRVERSIAKIIDIIEHMGDEDAPPSDFETQLKNMERLFKRYEWASMTVDDVVEDLKAGTFGGPNQPQTDRSREMQAALINGTAKVVDMEEYGYRTEASFNLHYDGAGNFGGSSVSFQRGGNFDLREFYAEHLIKQEDGRVIDGETGHNSNRIQIGGLDIFITWP